MRTTDFVRKSHTMKILLALIFATSTLFAAEPSAWNERFRQQRDLYGAGERPVVGTDTLDPGIVRAINQKLNTSNVEIVSWTQPALESTAHAGSRLGWWGIVVQVRGTSRPYGRVLVHIKNGIPTAY